MDKARGGVVSPARSLRSAPHGAEDSYGVPLFDLKAGHTAVAEPPGAPSDQPGSPSGTRIYNHSDRAVLKEAVRDVKSADARVRSSAIRVLGRLKERKVAPLLIQAFRDPSDEVRSACLDALSDVGEPSAGAIFKMALDPSESVRVRLAAVRGLYRLASITSAPALLKALKDSHPRVRRRAALCLGWLGADSDAPSLLPLFRDDYAEVRAAAVEAVGALKLRSAIPALIHALEDPDAKVCERANHSLERITGKSMGTAQAARGSAFRKVAKKWQGWWSVS